GETIVVKPGSGVYAAIPPEGNVQDTPLTGELFKGTLTGKLSVSPSGAATYTVPIMTNAGIRGMTPNLSLVYNSQAGDGIAGQGWSLDGTSTIYRCPKTVATDGIGLDVVGRSVTRPAPEPDGLCMDGKRLFPRPFADNEYDLELTD